MVFKTLLLSSCAIVVMASSYSASAMMNTDDDDNGQVPAAPAGNPNAQAAPDVNPDNGQAPAAPAVNPKTQAAPAVNLETTQGAGSSTSSRSTNSTTDEVKSQATNSQVVPQQDVDPELKSTLQFMMGAPDLVIDRMIFQEGLENMGNLYKAVEAGLADIKKRSQILAVRDKALAEKREGYVSEPALEKERAAGHAINQETQAQLEKVKARLDLEIMKALETEIIPKELQAQDDTQSKRQKKEIEEDIKAYIAEDIRDSAAAGKPINVFELWESGAVKAYFKVKKHLGSLKADDTVIDISYIVHNLRKVPPLDRFRDLKYVILSYNEFTSAASLQGLTGVDQIELDHNQFTSLESFKNLPSLRVLYLSYNRLTSLAGIEGIKSLRTIYVVHNQLTTLAGIEDLTNLKVISLRGNPLWEPLPGEDPDVARMRIKTNTDIVDSLEARGVEVNL